MHTADSRPPAARTAVTGLGVVTASGTTVAALYDDLRHGRERFTTAAPAPVANALPPGPGSAPAEAPAPVRAGHVPGPLPLTDFLGARTDRTLSRDSRLLIHAAATAGTGPAAERTAGERTGVVLGTIRAGRNEYFAIHDAAGSPGHRVNPVWGPHSGYNAAAAQLSLALGAEGPCLTLCAGTTAGLDAVATGVRQLRDGVCDTVLAAGADTLCAAAGTRAGEDGLPEGEGAALLVLEPAPTAGARALAQVLGTGEAIAPAEDIPTPDALGRAATEAVQAALREAGRPAAEIGLIVLVGSGDTPADRAVEAALRQLTSPTVPLSEVARVTGRTGGGDGTLAAALAVEALRRGAAPAPGAAPLDGTALCVGADPAGTATALLLGRPAHQESGT
ncbi:beta-ketoacyl synthase N-terminal-like domain-containing protein [Streptomyces physcomitrii]|uniref:Ketosynthase family 3 (KS3) domain-containing protein n=1 Tax=Streptomyces physcomitrii TaxID=2724184 RepID=A0ABX1GZL2_9ACTN|nr:beta-ketoacyl synthase N-terminal-like domain-containing protein [Streptomyces physcomitrii]NKI41526.1 hypothetical protein [Streptomyces physcomitrii]